MSEAKQLKALFAEVRREMAALKPWQRTNRLPWPTDPKHPCNARTPPAAKGRRK